MAYKSTCKLCKLSKSTPGLKKRIYHAKFNWQDGDETLMDIYRSFEGVFTKMGMYNHCNKHIDERRASESVLEVQTAKKVEKVRAAVNKELEVGFERGEMTITDEYELGLNDYIGQGLDILRKGNMKITEKGFLTAIKIKSDIQAKKRGQDIEIMKSIYSFSSGEKKQALVDEAKKTLASTTAGSKIGEQHAVTEDNAGSADKRAERPDSLYRAAAGNATS